MPSEYEDEVPDYALDDEDTIKFTLNDLEITNYENVDKILNQPEMTSPQKKSFLSKVLGHTIFRRNQLKGYQSHVTKAYKLGQIGEAERAAENKRIDDSRAVLNQYINHYQQKQMKLKVMG